jgi:hypothetical protein
VLVLAHVHAKVLGEQMLLRVRAGATIVVDGRRALSTFTLRAAAPRRVAVIRRK